MGCAVQIEKMRLSVIFLIVSAILVVLVCDQAQANKYKVVCYFTNWSYYRKNNGKFTPKDINTKLCTHIVYGFAILDPNSLTIKIHDSSIDNNLYKQITAFRKKGVKVTVAIGGWKDSIGSKYGRLLTNAGARNNFVKNAIGFIKKHNFQGLDLDLEVSLFGILCKLLKILFLCVCNSIVSGVLARSLFSCKCSPKSWLCTTH